MDGFLNCYVMGCRWFLQLGLEEKCMKCQWSLAGGMAWDVFVTPTNCVVWRLWFYSFGQCLIGSKVFVYPIQSVIVKLCSVDLSPLLHFQENIEKTEKTCGTESIFVVLKIVVQFAKAIRWWRDWWFLWIICQIENGNWLKNST